jgi:hypothetical protein
MMRCEFLVNLGRIDKDDDMDDLQCIIVRSADFCGCGVDLLDGV